MKTLGVITARGGSKAIPRKNICSLLGKPLIAYTIAAAQESRLLSRTIVSTDDSEIAEVARQYQAEVPFTRPAHLASDEAGSLPVLQHAVTFLEQETGWRADVVVCLQPTSPLRSGVHIDRAIEILLSSHADTVVTVVSVPGNFNPVSVMRMDGEWLKPAFPEMAGALRRQEKPKYLARNGPAVLAVTYETLMLKNTLYGDRIAPLLMTREESVDIDSPFDLAMAGWLMCERNRRAART